jgi:PIN domain nuclease of toxin-antitoxin system
VILLDTNALIWLEQGHVRVRTLIQRRARLYISPASLLELQFLSEAGRIRLRDATIADLVHRDDLWLLDDPPAADWFDEARELGWTRDPFDRLIVAHARLRRWQLATADAALLERLPGRERIAI